MLRAAPVIDPSFTCLPVEVVVVSFFLCLHMCTHAVLNLNLTHAFRCTTPYATAAADTDVTSFCVECFVLQSECSLVLYEAQGLAWNRRNSTIVPFVVDDNESYGKGATVARQDDKMVPGGGPRRNPDSRCQERLCTSSDPAWPQRRTKRETLEGSRRALAPLCHPPLLY